MFKYVQNRLQNDRGAAVTIEFLMYILLAFAIFSTIIDFGIYFNNRYFITNAAQNGARLAAIFGGVDENPISVAYGITSGSCSSPVSSDLVGCTVARELERNRGLVNTQVAAVRCGPSRTTVVGERVYCEVEYFYNGLPGSGLSFARQIIRTPNLVRMTGESEVVHK